MTSTISNELMEAWKKVKTNRQIMTIWPDRTGQPEKEFRVLYWDSMLATPQGAFRFEALAPAKDKGFVAGVSDRTFWLSLPNHQGSLQIRSLPAYDERRALRLLNRVVRESLRTMDFSLSKTIWEGRESLKTIATPDPWDNKFSMKMITFADTDTNVIKQAQVFDKNGELRQMWQVSEYQRDAPAPEGIFLAPAPAGKGAALTIDLAAGAAWDGAPIDGLTLWFDGGEKAAHKVQKSEFGPVLVSDFGDGVNLRLLLQLPKAAPHFVVPWATEVNINNAQAYGCLFDGYIFVTVIKGDRQSLILAQDSLVQVSEFVDRLTANDKNDGK